ncbi:hypothetical protein [uncultured Rhodoblastus sp.]|uniref:hypothetical protein n=1 Tax=uncultured Rhodoblastus sp. TaxID=543037 RepID=UPI0025E3F881|nr:hypothetical protein [uncultured Rhodoblastus sp.]
MKTTTFSATFLTFLMVAPTVQADENWKQVPCRTYIETFTNGGLELIKLVDEVSVELPGMNTPNAIDGLACECIGKDKSLGEAANALSGALKTGLWPQIPIGGATADPAAHRWAADFGNWIGGKGKRPSLNGHLACDYVRPN